MDSHFKGEFLALPYQKETLKYTKIQTLKV